jgi:hypothetical protein
MDSAHVVQCRLHQIKGHTEIQRGRGREETVKQRGDRDEYQKERQKRTYKGEEQTDRNTDSKTNLPKNAQECKRDDIRGI